MQEETGLEKYQRRKLSQYETYMVLGLSRLGFSPDDVLEVRLRNEGSTEAIIKPAQKVADIFYERLGVRPTSIAVHPAHKTLVIMRHWEIIPVLKDKHNQDVEKTIEGIPGGPVPWEFDESISLTEVAARYQDRH